MQKQQSSNKSLKEATDRPLLKVILLTFTFFLTLQQHSTCHS